MDVDGSQQQLRRGWALLAAKRPADARRVAAEVAAARPGDPGPLRLVARAEVALHDLPAAERTARTAIGYDPQQAESHQLLARVLVSRSMGAVDMGRYTLAAAALDAAHEALRLDPDDLSSLLVGAEAAAWSHRFDEAVRLVDEAVRRAPDLDEVWFARARVARLASDHAVAEAAARRALAINPDHYGASNELGIILRQLGDQRGAERQWVSSAGIDPVAEPARANLLAGAAPVVVGVALAITTPMIWVGVVMLPSAPLAPWLLSTALLTAVGRRVPVVRRRMARRAVSRARRAPAAAPAPVAAPAVVAPDAPIRFTRPRPGLLAPRRRHRSPDPAPNGRGGGS